MTALEALRAELASAGKLTLSVKVVPKSARTQMVGRMANGTLKVKVAAPPEKGKANAELCAFLAKQFGVPKSNVSVKAGHTAPLKRIRIVT